MKTILVPTDFSNEARQAFIYAMELATLTNSDLVLFHAFHQTISIANAYHVEENIQELEEEKKAELTKWVTDIKNELARDFSWHFTSTQNGEIELPNTLTRTKTGFHTIEILTDSNITVALTCASKFGLVAEEINNAAKLYKADLILMSSKGAGALSQALLGSTVATVIASSQVPVLTLPQHAPFIKPQTLVFAADLGRLEENAALHFLRNLVNVFRADLQVLYFYQQEDLPLEQKTQKGLDTLDIYLKNVSYRVNFRQRDDITTGIYEFVQQTQADWLVLVPRRHSILEKVLNKSVTGKITEQNFIPFLTLPPITRLAAVEP